MIKIIYEDNHLLVVEKPFNMLTQGDITGDTSVVIELKKYLKEKYNKPGNVYLGLVHRLDRPVGGVMVFAKTSKCAKRLSIEFKNGQIKKTYFAIIIGNIMPEKDALIDYLEKDNTKNIVKISEKGKLAKLEYEKLNFIDNMSLVKIDLITGRPHQIRVQFASRGFPLYGDHRYNKNVKIGSQIAMLSYGIEISHPIKKNKMKFVSKLPTTYPWNIF